MCKRDSRHYSRKANCQEDNLAGALIVVERKTGHNDSWGLKISGIQTDVYNSRIRDLAASAESR